MSRLRWISCNMLFQRGGVAAFARNRVVNACSSCVLYQHFCGKTALRCVNNRASRGVWGDEYGGRLLLRAHHGDEERSFEARQQPPVDPCGSVFITMPCHQDTMFDCQNFCLQKAQAHISRAARTLEVCPTRLRREAA